MSVISCSGCGKQVSTTAQTCPGCGAPIPARSGGDAVAALISLIYPFVVVALLVALLKGEPLRS